MNLFSILFLASFLYSFKNTRMLYWIKKNKNKTLNIILVSQMEAKHMVMLWLYAAAWTPGSSSSVTIYANMETDNIVPAYHRYKYSTCKLCLLDRVGWVPLFSTVHVCFFSVNCEEHTWVYCPHNSFIYQKWSLSWSSHFSEYESSVICNVWWFVMFSIKFIQDLWTPFKF